VADFRPLSLDAFRAQIAAEGAAAVARRLRARAHDAQRENAFTVVDDAAFEQVGGGSVAGPLAGIPIAVKDNIDTLPFPTTGACPAFLDSRPVADATVVARLRAAGAVIIGKTSLHELAFGITSNNAHFGAIPNPFDARRVAGGSSGGAGLVLARGVVPVALGSDTGGSVRIPAAFCNVVGLRPTTGRYPGDGVLNLTHTRDTIGVMATCVGDVAAIDAVITGEKRVSLESRPIRLGVLSNARPGLSKATDGAIGAAFASLQQAGFEVVPVAFAEAERLTSQIDAVIALYEIWQIWTALVREKFGVSLQQFAAIIASPDVRAAFANLDRMAPDLGKNYRDAMNSGRPALQRAYERAVVGHAVDALITATVPVPPPRIGEDDEMTVDGVSLPTFPTVIRNTSPASIAAVPSLALPAGFDAAGLPVGIMLEGLAGGDRQLLAVGARVEAALSGVRA
jgi:mandelamide amidase